VLWVYALPPGVLCLTVLLVMCALAAGGLMLFWRLVPQSDELTHNDVAGPIIGTVGTILAVILSFMLVTVWQQYDGAAATVEQEASAVADLYHLATEFPQPLQHQLQQALGTYINAVVDDEWPAMRTGGRSPLARRAVIGAMRIVAHYQPGSSTQQTLQQTALALMETMQDARRNRLFANDQGVPIFFWLGNCLLAAITIGLCFLFRVRSRYAHFTMTLALTAVIGTVFVLIALFDYPFRGYTQIPPTLFTQLQRDLAHQLTESD